MKRAEFFQEFQMMADAYHTTSKEMFALYEKAASLTTETIRRGNKILICGNGGSCSTAAHITNDFISHMLNWDRDGYPAISLSDAGVITAVANDYGFEKVFSRQVNALGKEGDLLWCFSTSGNSKNILMAVHEAKIKKMKTVGFTGKTGGDLKAHCDIWCPVNTDDLIKAEGIHLFLIHLLVMKLEEQIG